MLPTTAKIAREIQDYIKNCGGKYSDWYVGIAADPRKRLFTDHQVKEKGNFWIFSRECPNSDIAREIENIL
jgi:predicted GIY-YIG superfamily endonuclease